MATTRRHMDVPAARVWDVLSDAERYVDWVVGANAVRGVEGEWPEPGATFKHKVGVWPVHLRDSTSVLEQEAPRRLVLEVRIRPVGKGRLEMEIQPDGPRCIVTMIEVPIEPFYLRLATPLLDPLLDLRNRDSLRRLEACAKRLEDR